MIESTKEGNSRRQHSSAAAGSMVQKEGIEESEGGK